MHPYYRDKVKTFDQFSASLDYYRQCLSLPIYYSLTDSDQDYVMATIRDIIDAASE